MTKIGDSFEYNAPRGIQTHDPFAKPVWHALTTPPQKEKAARGYLLAQGIHAFYPDEEVKRTVRGKTRTVTKPMVSGYVFARFTGAPQWDVIRSRPFFTGVVCFNGMPWPFPRGDVRQMMGLTITAQERRRAMRERQEAIEAARMPRAGETARFVDGPLKGFVVPIERIAGGIAFFQLPGGFKGGQASVGMLERDE